SPKADARRFGVRRSGPRPGCVGSIGPVGGAVRLAVAGIRAGQGVGGTVGGGGPVGGAAGGGSASRRTDRLLSAPLGVVAIRARASGRRGGCRSLWRW